MSQQDVIECLEMMEETQKNLGGEKEIHKPMHDYKSRIFEILSEQCKYSDSMSVEREILLKRVLARGYSEAEMDETIEEYIKNDVIMVHRNTIICI